MFVEFLLVFLVGVIAGASIVISLINMGYLNGLCEPGSSKGDK